MEDRKSEKQGRRRRSSGKNDREISQPAAKPRKRRARRPANAVAEAAPSRAAARPPWRPVAPPLIQPVVESVSGSVSRIAAVGARGGHLVDPVEARVDEGVGRGGGGRRKEAGRRRPVVTLLFAGGTAVVLGVELLAAALWGSAATLAFGRPRRRPLRAEIAHAGFAIYDRLRERLRGEAAEHAAR